MMRRDNREPIVEEVHLPDEADCLLPGRGVVMHWYRPVREGPRRRAGIVVLPIQGGNYEVSAMLARWQARQGFHALRFERRGEWLDPDRPIEAIPDLVRQFEADILRGIAWWLAADGGPERLGLMGVSTGGIIGTSIAAAEPRIRASVLIIAGGDLPGILIHGRDEELDAWRAEVARRNGVTELELLPRLKAALDPVDNLRKASRVNPATTLFLASRFDRVVPWANSRQLWEALGRPPRRVFPCGHYSTVVFLPYVHRAARRWFDRHVLGEPTADQAPAGATVDGSGDGS